MEEAFSVVQPVLQASELWSHTKTTAARHSVST